MNTTDLQGIGATLVSIGALSAAELADAQQIAEDLGQPLLKLLVNSSFIPQERLSIALEAVHYVEQGLLIQEARAAYWLAVQKGISFRNALEECAAIAQRQTQPQKISAPAAAIARAQAASSSTAAAAQAAASPPPMPPAPVRPTAQRDPLMEQVRDLLLFSGTIDQHSANQACSLSCQTGQSIEEILYQHNVINKGILDAVLKIRSFIGKQSLTVLTATDILRKMNEQNITMHHAMAQLGMVRTSPQNRIRIGELLKQAGIVTEQQLEEALKLSTWNDTLIGKMLVICGFISETMLQNALRCQFLVREGKLTVDKAIIALHYCERTRDSIEEALKEVVSQCA